MSVLVSLLSQLPGKWPTITTKILIAVLSIGFSLLAIIFAYATIKSLLTDNFPLSAMFLLVLSIFLAALASLYPCHSNATHSKNDDR